MKAECEGENEGEMGVWGSIMGIFGGRKWGFGIPINTNTIQAECECGNWGKKGKKKEIWVPYPC